MAKARHSAGPGTPATVALTSAGIAFTAHTYVHDPATTNYGLEAASALGLDGIVPVTSMLDLKALAAAVGSKRAVMADPAVAERKTGYVVGGISPIGQKTPLPTVLDETAQLWPTIYVSGGRRGFDLELAPSDLLSVTNGRVADIAR